MPTTSTHDDGHGDAVERGRVEDRDRDRAGPGPASGSGRRRRSTGPARPVPRRTMRGTSDSADGRTMAIPAPCSIRTRTNGARLPPGVHARQQQDARRERGTRGPRRVNRRGAPNASTSRPPTRAAGIWTTAAAPMTSPIAASGDPGPGEGQRQRCGVGLEAHLDQEHRDGQAEDGHWAPGRRRSGSRSGRAGPCSAGLGGRRHPTGAIGASVAASRRDRRPSAPAPRPGASPSPRTSCSSAARP